MNAWSEFTEDNRELDIQMESNGFHMTQSNGICCYRNEQGEYIPYPVGYITGPGFCGNGNPNPWYCSVQGNDGWHQRGFKTREEAIAWAMEKAKEIKG